MRPGARRHDPDPDPAPDPYQGDEPIPYEQFRSSWDFASVRELLSHEQDQEYQAGRYMWVSRSTVLGRWHELKLAEYARYLAHFEARQDDPGKPWRWSRQARERVPSLYMTEAEAEAEGLPF